MDELVRWFGEQLDEDEARATQWHDLECEIHAHLDSGLIAAVAAARMLEEVPGAVCDCGGPARVLREIDADRKLLAQYAEVAANDVDDVEYAHGWANALGLAVRLRVSAFSDRPGFRPEWAADLR